MMKFTNRLVLCLLGVIFTTVFSYPLTSQASATKRPIQRAQAPINIADAEFNPADWSVTAETTPGASFVVEQHLTGGQSTPAFRFMSHRLPPVETGLAEVQLTHIYLGYIYEPRVEGPIQFINYTESGIILSFPWPEAFSTTRPVVVQNGRVFAARRFIRAVAESSASAWETGYLLALKADDFFPPGGAENDNPDFSAQGSPIQFGFMRTNTRSATLPPVPANEDLIIDQGVDNWNLTIYHDPSQAINYPPVANDDIYILDGNQNSLPIRAYIDALDNDLDPNPLDHLEIVAATQPAYGRSGILSSGTIFYELEQAQSADGFTYTVSDGEFTDSAQINVFVDCACSVLCLSNLVLPSRFTDTIDIPLIYRLRNQVLDATPAGKRYIEYYYTKNPEILVNILADSSLRTEALAGFELWQETLRSLVDGDGSALITQAQVDALQAFLDHLSMVSSPELQALIASELDRLGPLDDYAGLTIKAARSLAIGDPTLYLPVLAH